MRDVIVIQNLQKRGFDFGNVEEVLQYEAIERQPRVLDKAPKRISIKRAQETPLFGCKEEFKITFEEMMRDTTGEVFTLALSNTKRYLDKPIYVVLQTLIRQGISYNKSIADACYNMFRIICTIDCDTITKERVYDALQPLKETEYYSKQILEAVRCCLFGENPIGLYWNSIANYTGMYKQVYEKGREVVIEQCESEKDIDKFVSQYYKAAKADKEFLKTTYTSGISKALVAMLYYLKDKEPDICTPDNGESMGW